MGVPTSFIFKGDDSYDPYIEGLKPFIFHGFHVVKRNSEQTTPKAYDEWVSDNFLFFAP